MGRRTSRSNTRGRRADGKTGPPRDERPSAHRSYRGAWRARWVERRVREVARGAFDGVRERVVECARDGGDGRASPDPRSVFRWAFRSHDGSWAGAAPPISSKLRSIGSDRLASSADRRNKSHSRPTIWGNHRKRRVVNPENEVGDLPGRRLAAPSLDRAHFIFGKEHAAVSAVLTPRDTLARKQETPNDFGLPQGPTHDVGLRQRRRGRLRVHPGERRV